MFIFSTHLLIGTCKEGYRSSHTSSGQLKCSPIKMCTGDSILNVDPETNDNSRHQGTGRLCHLNATCEDTEPGQYQCTCKEGFVGDGKDHCRRKFHYSLV